MQRQARTRAALSIGRKQKRGQADHNGLPIRDIAAIAGPGRQYVSRIVRCGG
jgi:hypothetical protein